MAMMGLPICSRFMPLATHNARAPAMRRPCVLNELRNWCFIFVVLLSMKKAFLISEKGFNNYLPTYEYIHKTFLTLLISRPRRE
jgi:hypothetical protein